MASNRLSTHTLSIGVEGTLEIIELFEKVEGSIDQSWPKLDKSPSKEDVKYLRRAREVSKKSPDVDVQVCQLSTHHAESFVMYE